jgi:mannose-6-phosphate isomerase-like protein (cupin superfamily)
MSFAISREEEKKLAEARKNSPYVLTLYENGVDYPIPDLENASRKILIDRDTVSSTMCTWGYSKFDGKTSLHKKHSHRDCEEIMYIISGRGVGGVGEHETLQQAGDTIFVPRGETHWFYNPFDEPLEMMWLYTKPSLRDAGYNLNSKGGADVSGEVEDKQLT